jgi:hypothetical protein
MSETNGENLEYMKFKDFTPVAMKNYIWRKNIKDIRFEVLHRWL